MHSYPGRGHHRIDQRTERARHTVAEDVPRVRNCNHARLRNDDQELPAESVACPHIDPAPVVAPPLIAVAGRVCIRWIYVLHEPRSRFPGPTGRQDALALPHTVIEIKL